MATSKSVYLQDLDDYSKAATQVEVSSVNNGACDMNQKIENAFLADTLGWCYYQKHDGTKSYDAFVLKANPENNGVEFAASRFTVSIAPTFIAGTYGRAKVNAMMVEKGFKPKAHTFTDSEQSYTKFSDDKEVNWVNPGPYFPQFSHDIEVSAKPIACMHESCRTQAIL